LRKLRTVNIAVGIIRRQKTERYTMNTTTKLTAAALAVAFIAAPMVAQSAEERTKLGVLECTIEGGFGLLIGSSKNAACSFVQANGATENYTGKISKLGLDVGITGESFMKWIVFTPIGNEVGAHALQGTYVGVSADASLGIGLGANALVGGSGKKIGLQPFSVEGKTGLNLAVGLSKLSLDPAS
jgi:hypothetical protein